MVQYSGGQEVPQKKNNHHILELNITNGRPSLEIKNNGIPLKGEKTKAQNDDK